MPNGNFRLEEAVALLERTPGTLRSLLHELPERWLTTDEGEATWSPEQVVEHLLHAERLNWLPRVRHLLSGSGDPFPPFDQRAPNRSARTTLEDSLAEFAGLRRRSLAKLEELDITADRLLETGVHPQFGSVRLSELLATWVVHDLTHIGQIVRVMAKSYRSDVGPWRELLTILSDRERERV